MNDDCPDCDGRAFPDWSDLCEGCKDDRRAAKARYLRRAHSASSFDSTTGKVKR